MSKLMARATPSRAPSSVAAITPPAGPERMVRTGSRAARADVVMPPLDCITNKRVPLDPRERPEIRIALWGALNIFPNPSK